MRKRYKQLTLSERYQIQAMFQLKYSARKISAEINRSNKSISAELNRFKDNTYNAEKAHELALKKRTTAAKYCKVSPELIDKVDSLLTLDFSPEQIAGRMELENFKKRVSMHTIYSLIMKRQWGQRLPRQGKKYRKRQGITAGARLIPNRVDIDERPDDVELKLDIGHWEGDTVHGTDGYFVTLAERKSKLFLFALVKRKTKSAVSKAIIKLLKPYKKRCKSITFDNGGEFAAHEKISRALKCHIYFAKPYHSWQRGLNENSNGLLRRYFPKKTGIANISNKVLQEVSLLINIRPRKTLDYLSPLEVIAGKRVSLIVRI